MLGPLGGLQLLVETKEGLLAVGLQDGPNRIQLCHRRLQVILGPPGHMLGVAGTYAA